MTGATAKATELLNTVGVYFLDRSYTGIVFSFGRKYMHAVAFENPIRCVEIPRDEQLRPVLLAGQPYPIIQAAQRMLDSGLPFIGERAESVLRGLLKGETVEVEAEVVA